MSSVWRSTPALLRRQLAHAQAEPAQRLPCSCFSSKSQPRLPIASTSRSISSSSKQADANPSTLLTEHSVPQRENEAVTRITSLMKLGERLASQAGDFSMPAKLRGIGVYDKDRKAPLVELEEGEELPPLPQVRRMGDSYVQMDLLFSKDESLREQYVGGLSKVRMGRLMEDFDSLAGAAAYRYVLPDGADIATAHKYGFYLVTAAVDRMDLLRPLMNPDGAVPDLRLSGHVSYATSSSIEVFLRMSTIPSSASEESSTILLGRFAMACRSAQGGKHPVPKLVVDGPEEAAIWSMGREMREGKKMRSQKSLQKTPPTAEEAAMLHELFIQRAEVYDRKTATPADVVMMSDTRVNSAQLMHPQERNVHNKVFGGYLMRLAYETAYSTACLFSRSAVTFVALDELQFAQPVEIGSLLLLDSKVTFSPLLGEHHSFHVSVEAATCDLYSGEKKVTNVFHYTFAADKPLQRYVLPRTYRQAMQWLDAQRRRKVGIEVRQAYDQAPEAMQPPAQGPTPLLTPRPRPPGRPSTQRTTSSRLTALPTPSTPRSAARRARERERRSLDALGFGSDGEEMRGERTSLGGRISLSGVQGSREGTGVDTGADAGGSAEGVVERDPVEATTKLSRAPSPVPFPSTDPTPATSDPVIVVKPSSGPSTPPSNRQTSPLEPVLAPAALGPDHLKSLSREELEKMLAEADRIIRAKEQELSVFTHAGEELLQEYHSLRQRHESLVARKPSTSGSATPFLPSSLSASVQTLPGAPMPPGKSPARLRPSRESLGRPSPASSRHLRRASGASSYHLHEKGSFASDPESPSQASRRSSRISVFTPDDSPTNTRRRQFSSVTPKSPAARLGIPASVFSPATAARDVASLNQANYALSLQLSDLQADSEVAEREGRKRLRKLERELQALREDLERVEQRNVVLETQAEVAISGNNELMRSIRRYDTMQSKIAAESRADQPVGRSLVSDDEDDPRASQSAPKDDLFTSHAPSGEPFSPGFADKSHLSPFRQPGHGSLFPLSFPRSISRSASASSLVPLPAPIELDPSLEQQQDELVDQLMAKIDELQDANEAILAEREEMVCRLDEVQEEVLEWKERCEELEEEIVQNRLVGWEGPIGAIEWRAEEDADAESEADEPSSIRKTRTRPLTVKRSSTSSSVSTGLSGPTCTSSPVTAFAKLPPPPERTLSNELGEQWSTDVYERDDPFDEPSFSSVIDHGLRPDIRHSKLELATSAPSEDEYNDNCPTPPFATTTADDLLHSGILRYAGYPDAETYDEIEKAAASLVPAWEDDEALPTAKSRRRKALPPHSIAKGKNVEFAKYDGRAAGRSTAVVLHPDRIYSDEDDFEDEEESPRSSRRWHALRRLQREASSRRGKFALRRRPTVDSFEGEYDSDDFESDISSDYDHLNHSLRRSSDYYPLSIRARYRPRMVVARVTDSVVQKIVSFVTWIRFFTILGMAIVFAVWQGPQKTLGIVDRRRRIR
ncbi:hypothetical protein NBRC10512v2_000751 [Rhodotorula toruloides]